MEAAAPALGGKWGVTSYAGPGAPQEWQTPEEAFLALFVEMVLRQAVPSGQRSPWGSGIAGEFYRDLFLQVLASRAAAALAGGPHLPGGAASAPAEEAGPATQMRLRP